MKAFTLMAKTKIALALSAMPETPPQTIIDLSKSAEENGFAGVFLTEAGNDSLAYCIGVGAHRVPSNLAPR